MHLKKIHFLLSFIILSVTFAFISYNRAMRADINGDYYIYWQTGQHFIGGEKLYTPGLVDGGFTYPPFAALFFSLFSLASFHWSAFLFTYLVNYGLWIASFLLVRKIFALLYPRRNINMPLILSALLSIAFYWHNFIWMNANLPVLCLTLLGIQYYIQKRYNLSYLFFMAGAFFKITPAIFLFFAAVKQGPKHWLSMAAMALPFIIAPWLLRGWHTGLADWQGYYEAFVAPFSNGKVDENIISLGVPALLDKLNTGNAELNYPAILHVSAPGLKIVTLVFQLLALAALTFKFIYERYAKGNDGFSAADYCLISLVTLLLPGRVWAHHHVCTSFIYTYVFMLLWQRKSKLLFYITFVLCLLLNLITKDVIGQTLTNLFKFYALPTLVMLFISAVIIVLAYKPKNYLPETV